MSASFGTGVYMSLIHSDAMPIYLDGQVRHIYKDCGDKTTLLVFVGQTWSKPFKSGMKGLTNSSSVSPLGKQLVTMPTMIKQRLADYIIQEKMTEVAKRQFKVITPCRWSDTFRGLADNMHVV